MKLSWLYFIALCCVPLLAEDTSNPTDSTTEVISTSSLHPESSTPSLAPTTTTTTEKPTTEKPTTAESTTASTTVSTTEPTTTEVPTTTSSTEKPTSTTDAPTTTTTEEPTTSTNVPPTSTVKPTPPAPKINDYVLKDGDMVCARLQLNISAKIPYSEVNGTGVYELMPNTSMTMLDSSTCNGPNGTEVIQLLVEGKHHLDIVLLKDKDNKVSLSLNLTYSQEDMENATNPDAVYSVISKDLWSVPASRSYLCNSEVSVTLSPAENITGSHEVVAKLWDVRYMAYVNQTKTDYSQEMECDQDTQMADIVPIAVGVALAALVVLVVIAYTVSRRRTKQRGYQSV